MEPLTIWRFTGGPAETNGFLIGDPATRRAFLFDAPKDITAPLGQEARRKGLTVVGLVNSHGHWDHIADNAAVLHAVKCPLACHPDDERRLLKPDEGVSWLPFDIPPTIPDRRITEGEQVVVGTLRFRVLHTPGHTEGSICLYEPDRRLLLSGDTLFQGTHGRTDLPGGDQALMVKSLARLVRELPGEAVVLPGHGPDTTLGAESPWMKQLNAGG